MEFIMYKKFMPLLAVMCCFANYDTVESDMVKFAGTVASAGQSIKDVMGFRNVDEIHDFFGLHSTIKYYSLLLYPNMFYSEGKTAKAITEEFNNKVLSFRPNGGNASLHEACAKNIETIRSLIPNFVEGFKVNREYVALVCISDILAAVEKNTRNKDESHRKIVASLQMYDERLNEIKVQDSQDALSKALQTITKRHADQCTAFTMAPTVLPQKSEKGWYVLSCCGSTGVKNGTSCCSRKTDTVETEPIDEAPADTSSNAEAPKA